MKRVSVALFVMIVVVLMALPGLAAAKGGPEFEARLGGGATNSTATGKAKFELEDGVLKYKLQIWGLNNTRMAHIHLQTGEIVAWLYPDPAPVPFPPPPPAIPGTFNGVLNKGTVTAAELTGPLAGQGLDALLAQMAAGNTYVNVHTDQFPGGEIRGDIRPDD